MFPPPSFTQATVRIQTAELMGANGRLVGTVAMVMQREAPHILGDGSGGPGGVAKRLRAAGFGESDIFVRGASPRKANLVVRYRGSGALKPILLPAHTDLVEANREDWSSDRFSSSRRTATIMAAVRRTTRRKPCSGSRT